MFQLSTPPSFHYMSLKLIHITRELILFLKSNTDYPNFVCCNKKRLSRVSKCSRRRFLPMVRIVGSQTGQRIHSVLHINLSQLFILWLGSLNKSITAPIKSTLIPIIPDGFGPSKMLCVDSDTKIGTSPIIFTAP